MGRSGTLSGKADMAGGASRRRTQSPRRGSGDSMYTRESARNTGSPTGVVSDEQPDAREGGLGRDGVTERS